nr:low affinity immunoglobulin epsilon Fc receptor-like isoform X2 [Procambarus clarkii]
MAKLLLLLLLELCLICHHTCGEQQPEAIECFAPFTAVHLQCVLVVPDVSGSWYEMRNYCQDLRGELVKVDSDNFMYYLVRYILDNGLDRAHYWIGGSDEGHEGDFLWTDGTNVKMGTPFWGDGVNDQIQEPDGGTSQNCIVMTQNDHYFFFDSDCNAKAGAICEQA